MVGQQTLFVWRRCLCLLYLTCLFVFGSMSHAVLSIPEPIAPVIDQTGYLTDQEVYALNQQLAEFRLKTGSQVAVLIIPSVEPETPFDYGMRVLDRWKLGRQGVSDGVLLLLIPEKRKSQILVGRGLEGAIPDVYAKRILEDTLRPFLQQDRRFEGIRHATRQMQALIGGEDLPAFDGRGSGPTTLSGGDLIFIAIMAMFVQGILTSIFGRFLGGSLTGILSGGLAHLMGFGLLISLGVGLGIAILSIFLKSHGIAAGSGSWPSAGGVGRRGGIGWSPPLGGGWSNGGGWSGGGFGGGWGGWGGGGGGFGGGGASGGW